jgi:hypothetical protein
MEQLQEEGGNSAGFGRVTRRKKSTWMFYAKMGR